MTDSQGQAPAAGTPMSGAESLIRSLEAAGTEHIFGIPGGAILPAYDPLMDSSIRHILVRHEQGAGHAAQGYAAATGRVGVCMATSGPGATNLVTPIADAHMDSVPLVAVTGQVGAKLDRHRRLPGGRHPRHHDADHQAQLPGHRPGRDPAHHRRGVLPRLDRPPRPGAGRRREVGAAGRHHLRVAHRAQPARLPPGDPPALQADPRGDPAAARVAAPGALRRRRHDPRPRLAGAQGARGVHRHPGGHHPDGARRLPRLPPAAPRHARHARHGRRGRRAPAQRPDRQPRRALRRPRHRQPRLVRPGREGHPRRHRPGRDRQEPRRRRPDRRGLPRGDQRSRRGPAGRGRRRPHRRLRGVGGVPRRREDQVPARVRRARRRHPRPAAGHGAPRCAGRRGRHLLRGRRAAPDVGRALRRLREAAHLDQLRRPRHDGLRRPRGDGRQGRLPRRPGVGDRRRRLLPDDQPGARPPARSTTSRSRWR